MDTAEKSSVRVLSVSPDGTHDYIGEFPDDDVVIIAPHGRYVFRPVRPVTVIITPGAAKTEEVEVDNGG